MPCQLTTYTPLLSVIFSACTLYVSILVYLFLNLLLVILNQADDFRRTIVDITVDIEREIDEVSVCEVLIIF